MNQLMKNRNILLLLSIMLMMAKLLSAGAIKTISTFHSMGLYWSPEGGSDSLSVFVRFRADGTKEWHEGLPMRYNPIGATDNDLGDYRGSVVNLTPNTSYEIELTLEGTSIKDTVSAKTWTENFPIAKTIKVGNMGSQLVPLESGTPEGYILYDGSGSTIDVGDSASYCMFIVKNYIIIRGFTLKNATRSAINLMNCHNVVIENCDISGWGERDKDGFGKNYQAAVYSSSPPVKCIVVQRCKIHNPRWDSNSWSELNNGTHHPQGPQAIALKNSAGNHVFRYNEIWSDDEHMYNDIIGYMDNSGYEGSPNCDTDIYGNYLSHCQDDGIEADGADRNVRIWGNYIERNLIPISNTPVTIGPLYIWKNTSGKANSKYSAFIKMGSTKDSENRMKGITYLFNNTILQPDGKGFKGVGKSSRKIKHCVTRNNVLNARGGDNSISTSSYNIDYDFDYDLCNGKYPSGEEPHGIDGTPSYIDGAVFDYDNLTANFFLKSGSLGYDAGVVIPNFVERYNGSAPDMGAFEAGDEPTEYGTKAYMVTGVTAEDKVETLDNYLLSQNYPNPFNPRTTISYQIPKSGRVVIKVFDLLGREVAELANGVKNAGKYQINFDASMLSSGMYIYSIQAGNFAAYRKMLLLK